MKKYKQDVSQKRKQKNPKNKKHKIHLTFDEKAREDFLTGFKKRKDHRRTQAQVEMIEKLKSQKKEIMKEKQERLRERLQQFSSVSGIEELLPPKVYELPNQTVTISTIGTDMMEKANLMLGSNLGGGRVESDDEDVSDPEEGSSKFSFGKTPPKKPDVSKKGKHKKELAKISQMIAQQKNQKRRGGKMKQLKRKRRKK